MSGIATGAIPRWRDSLTDRHWPIFELEEVRIVRSTPDEKKVAPFRSADGHFLGRYAAGCRSSPCGRNRCGQRSALRRRASGAGPGRRAGPKILVFHRGLAQAGRMAEALWSSYGGHAIHRSLLDSAVRHSGATWSGSVPGERERDAESAGPQERCPGMPVALEAPHPRPFAEFLSSHRRSAPRAHAVAATGRSSEFRGPVCATDAESVNPNEPAHAPGPTGATRSRCPSGPAARARIAPAGAAGNGRRTS